MKQAATVEPIAGYYRNSAIINQIHMTNDTYYRDDPKAGAIEFATWLTSRYDVNGIDSWIDTKSKISYVYDTEELYEIWSKLNAPS